jgi:hypothetical protein
MRSAFARVLATVLETMTVWRFAADISSDLAEALHRSAFCSLRERNRILRGTVRPTAHARLVLLLFVDIICMMLS